MENNESFMKILLRMLSYVLVAALASAATWFLAARVPDSKLEELADVIDRKFIAEADQTAIQDAAAEAMVDALGDQWSYYIPAALQSNYDERRSNEYVGIGVSVMARQDGAGYDIVAVTAGGPAEEAGILPGDIATHADGKALSGLNVTEVRALIMGKEGTSVKLTVLRDGQSLEIAVTRKTIRTKVAEGRMLAGNIGYITIANFFDHAGEESIEAAKSLVEAGAEALIFDVRDNPGGYVHEMVKILDHLLPEGPLFRSVSYSGKETVEESDAACVELPMAVLINGNTYSAAEFFAAALSEYDWAVTVGEQTSGKGYYQTAHTFSDGSGVSLSTGKYTTPNGVSLAEAGGLTPDIPTAPAEGKVEAEEDPQILAAIAALSSQNQ